MTALRRKTQGHRVIKFVEQNCVHPDGPLVGQPLLVHSWWRQTILELFEVVYDEREQRWRRRYSEAYISVGKKNAKALSLQTPLPTPTGWTTMGEVREGDTVFDERGQPCAVVLTSEVMIGQPCYRVVFSDGSEIVADAGHLWLTSTANERTAEAYFHQHEGYAIARCTTHQREGAPPGIRRWHARPECVIVERRTRMDDAPSFASIKTTRELADSLIVPHNPSERNHAIRVAGALVTPAAELPITPYALGCWLGDGSSDGARLTVGEQDMEMLEHITASGETVTRVSRFKSRTASVLLGAYGTKTTCLRGHPRPASYTACLPCARLVTRERRAGRPIPPATDLILQKRLAAAGLLRNKHIPPAYLRASQPQRLALLQGLMDTDGTISRRGQAGYCSTSPDLARGVLELVRSLGFKATIRERRAILNGRDCGPVWNIDFTPFDDVPVFQLARKRARQKPRPAPKRGGLARSEALKIVAVEPVASVPVRCIQVDSPSRLYLAGPGMVPTHNTSCLAAIGLYFLLADVDPDTQQPDPSALVVSAAASEEQGANLLYGSAKTMCELSPSLRQLTQPFEKEILVPSLARARMRNVASKAGTQDGANIKALLADELHEWKGQRGRDLYQVLKGGTGARPNAMAIAITTAGYDQDSVCYERYIYGKKVLSGEIDDPGFYCKIAEAPEDADYRDPSVWALANPLLGVSVLPSYIADRVKRDPESVVRRYNLNQWVAAENIWLPYGSWEACEDASLELDPALPLFVGIDIARNIDSSALAMVQRQETADGVRYVVRCRVWSNPYREDEPAYASWRMNNNLVMELCRELFGRFPVAACAIDDEVKPGPCFLIDPWRFRPEAEKLTAEGLGCVFVPQSDARMIPISQALREAVIQREVAHDGDPILKRHIYSVVADQKERGWRISKTKGSGKKIDSAVATAIALYQAQTAVPLEARSVYEERELLVLG